MTLRSIDANTLKIWLQNGEAMLVDVREPAEHKALNITAAKSVPLASISKKSLPNTDGKKLVIHCLAGKRGQTACEKLLAEDPNIELYNLEGGISAWRAAGFEVNQSDAFFLPLDRQVQLTIGVGVLIGSLLTYYINPLFFILTGFFGAGLTFAGLSGYCGLALFMAKMPWNQSAGSLPTCSTK